MIQDTARDIRAVCNEIAELLVSKNASYGDSALNPINCFAKDATVLEKLGVRIDDKLSRVLRGNDHFNEDTELDLLGYLVLRRIHLMRAKVEASAGGTPPRKACSKCGELDGFHKPGCEFADPIPQMVNEPAPGIPAGVLKQPPEITRNLRK